MTRLIAELQRRGVVKVAAAYALAAWILIEAGSVLFPTFGASESCFGGFVFFFFFNNKNRAKKPKRKIPEWDKDFLSFINLKLNFILRK